MNLTACLETPMPEKKKMGRPSKGRNDVSVKLDATVASRAKVVAGLMKKTLVEYLTEIVGPIVDRDLKKNWDKINKPD